MTQPARLKRFEVSCENGVVGYDRAMLRGAGTQAVNDAFKAVHLFSNRRAVPFRWRVKQRGELVNPHAFGAGLLDRLAGAGQLSAKLGGSDEVDADGDRQQKEEGADLQQNRLLPIRPPCPRCRMHRRHRRQPGSWKSKTARSDLS